MVNLKQLLFSLIQYIYFYNFQYPYFCMNTICYFVLPSHFYLYNNCKKTVIYKHDYLPTTVLYKLNQILANSQQIYFHTNVYSILNYTPQLLYCLDNFIALFNELFSLLYLYQWVYISQNYCVKMLTAKSLTYLPQRFLCGNKSKLSDLNDACCFK